MIMFMVYHSILWYRVSLSWGRSRWWWHGRKEQQQKNSACLPLLILAFPVSSSLFPLSYCCIHFLLLLCAVGLYFCFSYFFLYFFIATFAGRNTLLSLTHFLSLFCCLLFTHSSFYRPFLVIPPPSSLKIASCSPTSLNMPVRRNRLPPLNLPPPSQTPLPQKKAVKQRVRRGTASV